MRIIGLDVGGTKCAVGVLHDGRVKEVARIPTGDFVSTFAQLDHVLRGLIADEPAHVGISCGGPLDEKNGVILNPPNLNNTWHGVAIGDVLRQHFDVECTVMNDANACALAEWKFGAGRGARHMIFLTSGTGFGAGLILNGALYVGATGDAGEIGHVRLTQGGPLGYGKCGSVEGWCSGGGIARLAAQRLHDLAEAHPFWAKEPLSAKLISEQAKLGDGLAREIMESAGSRLGETLAVLIDLVNPECIVLGGFYPACRDLLDGPMRTVLAREALPGALAACQILPSELGPSIGCHGAVSAALQATGNWRSYSPHLEKR